MRNDSTLLLEGIKLLQTATSFCAYYSIAIKLTFRIFIASSSPNLSGHFVLLSFKESRWYTNQWVQTLQWDCLPHASGSSLALWCVSQELQGSSAPRQLYRRKSRVSSLLPYMSSSGLLHTSWSYIQNLRNNDRESVNNLKPRNVALNLCTLLTTHVHAYSHISLLRTHPGFNLFIHACTLKYIS